MQLSEALEQIDGMIDLVNALMLQNQPDSTEQAIRQLRDGMEAFAGLAQRFDASQFTPDNTARMHTMSERLTQMRGHIAKLSAMTGQQLAALMPEQAVTHTYGGTKQPGGAASVARMYHISG
ncbi:MAG: outer membrane protein assembly factor BamD [Comamonadaceae bacterium]|nr:outer membrane protein assembly factor BamD [Comamonadaceae bacterium]